jgi:hypothetical protein
MSLLFAVYVAGLLCLTGQLRLIARERLAAELTRLSADLPPARAVLDWPEPLSPLDLPGIGHTEALADVALSSRIFEAAPEPLVVGLAVTGGRHHLGVAPGTEAQRLRWNSPTGQFWAIVDDLGDLWEPCSHCAAPEDGEQAHAGCPGCSCPCGLVEAVAA